MFRKLRIVFVTVVLLALAAFAIEPLEMSRTAQYLMAGLYVGTDAPGAAANKVTRMLGGSGTIDFATQTITCNTSNITVTGAQTGDPCFVGPPSSGGAANSQFTCYVSATNTVTVKHCPAGTASDPASATYFVRVISSQ